MQYIVVILGSAVIKHNLSLFLKHNLTVNQALAVSKMFSYPIGKVLMQGFGFPRALASAYFPVHFQAACKHAFMGQAGVCLATGSHRI